VHPCSASKLTVPAAVTLCCRHGCQVCILARWHRVLRPGAGTGTRWRSCSGQHVPQVGQESERLKANSRRPDERFTSTGSFRSSGGARLCAVRSRLAFQPLAEQHALAYNLRCHAAWAALVRLYRASHNSKAITSAKATTWGCVADASGCAPFAQQAPLHLSSKTAAHVHAGHWRATAPRCCTRNSQATLQHGCGSFTSTT
jgi:hypothetical protein